MKSVFVCLYITVLLGTSHATAALSPQGETTTPLCPPCCFPCKPGTNVFHAGLAKHAGRSRPLVVPPKDQFHYNDWSNVAEM